MHTTKSMLANITSLLIRSQLLTGTCSIKNMREQVLPQV